MTKAYHGRYIAEPFPTYDALQKATGELPYTDDLAFHNLLWGKVLTSPHAHAHILSIDTAQAEALPGVRAVITWKDAPDTLFNRIHRWSKDGIPCTERVLDQTVRFVGDKVAAVAADTEAIAKKAVSLIKVEYEVLPAVFDQEEALKEDAPKIYPDGNLLKEQIAECGSTAAAIADSPIVVENECRTTMIHHGAIEPHVTIARWGRGDELSVWEPQQGPHRCQLMLARIFDLPYSKIRIHGQNIGGTFGGKDGILLEPLALLLSRKAGGAPVKIRYDRKESICSTYTRHAFHLYGKMGLDPDGTIRAFAVDSFMNAGPYCGGSINVQSAMCGKMFKVYHVPNMRFHGRAVYTNTPVGGAMRGFGSPAVFAELELLINKAAAAVGMDPVAFRRKNLIEPFGTDPAAHDSLGSACIKECLIKGAEEFGWESMKEYCRTHGSERYAYGVGVGCAMHGNGVAPFAPDITVAELELHEDGSVMVRTALSDHGAGTNTLIKQIAAETLRIPPDHVEITRSDTHTAPYDMGAGASRNTWSGGSAVWACARRLRDSMKKTAAAMFGAHTDDVTMDEDGVFHDRHGRTATGADIACFAYSVQHRRLIEAESYHSEHGAGSYGAHFSLVRVDRTTGEVKVLEHKAMCDIGTPLNPMLLTGQLEGAIAMGLGMALFEGVCLDENGKVLSNSFKKYRLPKASDMPEIKIRFVDNYEEGGPFGGKSVGESSITPVAPAIIGAVNDALGTDLHEMPLTPGRVLAAIKEKERCS